MRLWLGAVLMVSLAYARTDVPSVQAKRLAHPPKSNADPSDPAWQDCPVATPFLDTFTERPAPDQTEGRLAYDEEALYALFVCHDSKPDQIIGREIEPEATFNGEDTVTLSLDTFNSHSGASLSKFTVNAINTQAETIAGVMTSGTSREIV